MTANDTLPTTTIHITAFGEVLDDTPGAERFHTCAHIGEDDRGKRQQVILQQLAWKAQRGPLSDAQVDLAFKLADQLATEPQPAEIAAGRREITGKLVAIKESFGAYGSSLRATVVHVEDGKKAVFNGTLPASLTRAKLGSTVAMTATVEPRDEGFAFYKRPGKARVLEAVGA